MSNSAIILATQHLFMWPKHLKKSIPKNEVALCWGSEAFLIVIANVTADEDKFVTEKNPQRLVKLLSENINIMLSISITSVNAERSIDLDIKHADELLYKAKEQAKNRACSF